MFKLICGLTILVALAGFIAADVDLSKVNSNDIQQLLQSQVGNPNEALEKAKGLVKDKCIEVSGEEAGTKAYSEIEDSVKELMECATSLINITAIQQDIENAPMGELDTVFARYCSKRPEAFKCIDNFNAKLTPCLDEAERESQAIVVRVVQGILNFICHKDGDQIALFIAESGPECFSSKREEVQQCFNQTFSHYIPKGDFTTINHLPKFVMEKEQCEDMQRLETCVVEKLEGCKETTPANLVESMFRFVKRETGCKKKQA